MATRSNIKITDDNGNAVWLYRHWDGYPACNGVCIAQALKRLSKGYSRKYGSFAPLINHLLWEERFKDSFSTRGERPCYEITSGEHGDIEWLYTIECEGNGAVTITVDEFSYSADCWREHGTMTEQEFRDFCARELAEMRKRVNDFNRQRRAA